MPAVEPPDRSGQPETLDAGTVIVGGRSERTFDRATLVEMAAAERRYTVDCASGERTTARWTGVPVPDLLDAASIPPETTHLQLVGHDGYRVPVPIRDALDGLVAYARDGTSLAATEPYAVRFLVPGGDAERLVRGLRSIDPLELSPEDDPDRRVIAASGDG